MLSEIERFVNRNRKRSPEARAWKDYDYNLRFFVEAVGDRYQHLMQRNGRDAYMENNIRRFGSGYSRMWRFFTETSCYFSLQCIGLITWSENWIVSWVSREIIYPYRNGADIMNEASHFPSEDKAASKSKKLYHPLATKLHCQLLDPILTSMPVLKIYLVSKNSHLHSVHRRGYDFRS